MKLFLGLCLHLGLSQAMAVVGSEKVWGPHQPTIQRGHPKRHGGSGGGYEPINIDLTVWKPGSTEQQWYSDITVGTPPQKLVIFDTGAPFLLLPRDTCTDCGEQHHLFKPSTSTTFSTQPGYPLQVYFGTTAGAPEGANCTAVSDTVRMAGHSAMQQQFLLCHTYSQGLRVHPPDGLFGLGSTLMNTWYGPNEQFKAAYWQLVENGELPRPEFSFSFVGNAHRDGVLTIGGTDPSLYWANSLKKIPLDWPLSESRNRWVVGVTAAKLGGYQLANSTNAVALVDTGTPNMITPDWETAHELYGRMSDQIKPINDQGSWGAPCAVLDRVACEVWFTLGSGADKVEVYLKKEHINTGEYPGKPGICEAILASPLQGQPAREPINGRPAWIFGNKLLKGYYTVWNGADRTMGWAQLR